MVLFFTENNDTVTNIFYNYEFLSENEIEKGIQFDGVIPNPENIIGKTPVMKYNSETQTIYYEYVNRPLTPEEELKQLKEKQDLTQSAIDDLILGGAL